MAAAHSIRSAPFQSQLSYPALTPRFVYIVPNRYNDQHWTASWPTQGRDARKPFLVAGNY
jgi:hypothetical protein